MGAFLGRALYVDRHKDTAAVLAVTTVTAAAILPWLEAESAAKAGANAASVALGMQLYVSFLAGPTMIFNLDRQIFADIQSKLFPKFGLATSAIGLWAMAAAFLGRNADFENLNPAFWTLTAGTLCSLVNWVGLFPAQIAQLEKGKKESDEDKKAKLKKKFGMYHGISMLVNMISMGCNIAAIAMT